jgi:hypothetical protein
MKKRQIFSHLEEFQIIDVYTQHSRRYSINPYSLGISYACDFHFSNTEGKRCNSLEKPEKHCLSQVIRVNTSSVLLKLCESFIYVAFTCDSNGQRKKSGEIQKHPTKHLTSTPLNYNVIKNKIILRNCHSQEEPKEL